MGWGYAIGAGLSMIDGALQYDRQKALDRDEREFQREMAQTTYERQLDFWDKQNEYNLPKNQRARLEDAGYNILDLMRNGSAMQTAGSLSSVATAGAGRGSQAPIGTMAEGAVALQNVQSQTRLNDSTVSLQQEKMRAEQLDNIQRQIRNLEGQDSREARVRLNYYYERERQLLEAGEASIELSRSQKLANDALADLRNEQISTEQATQALRKANADQLSSLAKTYASQISLNEAQARQLDELARKLSAETDKLVYAFEILQQSGFDITQGGLFGALERRSYWSDDKTIKPIKTWFKDIIGDVNPDDADTFIGWLIAKIVSRMAN